MKQGKRNSTDLQGFCVSLTGLKKQHTDIEIGLFSKQQDTVEKTNIQNLLNIRKQSTYCDVREGTFAKCRLLYKTFDTFRSFTNIGNAAKKNYRLYV